MARALAGLLLLLSVQTATAQTGDWETGRRHSHHGARILVLKNYHLDADSTARGPVVVIGGSATVDGKVEDDVVVLGGSLRLGPKAEVDGDVVTVGGEAQIDPQAQVRGEVNETVMRWPSGDWDPLARRWFAGLALAATVTRLILVFVVASLLTLVAPGWVRAIARRVADQPGFSILTGVACEVAFVPVAVAVVLALVVSIIGIPLIGLVPFLAAAAAVAGTAGFAAVAARIGARLRGTTVESSSALYVDMLLGFVTVTAVSVTARIVSFGPFWTGPFTLSLSGVGFLIEWVVWTVGIGAACASLLSGSRGSFHAPGSAVPPTAPAPTL